MYLTKQIVLNENALLEELSVEYVPQIGFLTALHERFSDLKPDDFTFAFTQVNMYRYLVFSVQLIHPSPLSAVSLRCFVPCNV